MAKAVLARSWILQIRICGPDWTFIASGRTLGGWNPQTNPGATEASLHSFENRGTARMKQRHHSICRLVFCIAPLLLVGACSESTAPDNEAASGTRQDNEQVSTESSKKAAASDSALSAYVGEGICDILPATAIESIFGTAAELTTESKNSRSSSKCEYSWPRPDAEERKQAMVQQMMQNMQRKEGEKIKLDVRKMSTDFSIGVDLKETRSSAATFVPVKLSEEELQKKIAQASEAANKRLTDEQKKVLGKDGAEGMVGGMMRKANERVVVEGVGDAAYWLPMMGGSLSVLAGGYQLTITPMVADDDAGNIEAARKIVAAILR